MLLECRVPAGTDDAAWIVDTIQGLITQHQLRVGDRLPSERQIARHLGVGRAAVRDAVSLLEERGLLVIKPRSGTYVADVTPSLISSSIERYMVYGGCSLQDLAVLRMALEPEAAALAAECAMADDLQTLAELIDNIEGGFRAGNIARYVANDVEFHCSLASASHNELFAAILGGLLRAAIKNSVEQLSRPPRAIGVYSHRPIYEAILAKDVFGARAAMQTHMSLNRQSIFGWQAETEAP